MNLTFGTMPKNLEVITVEVKYKFAELKKLIELCDKRNVSLFHVGDLKIVFGRQTKESPLTPPAFQTKESEVQAEQIESQAIVQASKELDDSDLSIMQIENPSRYEQMLLEGELEDDGSESEFRDAEQLLVDRAELPTGAEKA